MATKKKTRKTTKRATKKTTKKTTDTASVKSSPLARYTSSRDRCSARQLVPVSKAGKVDPKGDGRINCQCIGRSGHGGGHVVELPGD